MDDNLQAMLSAPFEDSDIEWRLQWADEVKGTGIAVPYVTNRAIQHRLDRAAGIDGWKNEYVPWHSDGKKASQLCGISIYFKERGEWVTKYDGAEDSDIEPVKGGLSDSMKRAAVQWGIGRYLYSTDTVFVDIEKRGKSTVIKDGAKAKLNDAHQRVIRKVFGTGRQTPPPNRTMASASGKPVQSQATPFANGKPAPTPAPVDSKAVHQPALAESKDTRHQTPMEGKAAGRLAHMDNSAARHPTQAEEPMATTPVGKPLQQQGRPVAPQLTPRAGSTYQIIDAVQQPSVRGVNTNLRLKSPDGKIVMAFMQGMDPSLVKGVRIENAVISERARDGIVFYTLDSFKLAA